MTSSVKPLREAQQTHPIERLRTISASRLSSAMLNYLDGAVQLVDPGEWQHLSLMYWADRSVSLLWRGRELVNIGWRYEGTKYLMFSRPGVP